MVLCGRASLSKGTDQKYQKTIKLKEMLFTAEVSNIIIYSYVTIDCII